MVPQFSVYGRLFVAVCVLGVAASGTYLRAQKFEMGAGFVAGVPAGEFGDSLDATGYGFSIRFGYLVGDGPIRVGGDFGFLRYGSEKHSEILLSDIPDVRVDVETTNNILLGHFFLRAQPRSGAVRPYAEALIGVSYLFTDTSIQNERTGEEFASSINLDDSVFSYGFGGGVELVLWDGMKRAGTPIPIQLLLDGRLRYLRGSNARYLKEGSISRENDQVTYEILESRTDLLLPEISLALRF
ncbi:MAG: outer membrane beta-barrel protein [Acidobacteriota bacterium]